MTLKPCPFCGFMTARISASVAACGHCGASVEMGYWNSRPTEDKLRAALEKIIGVTRSENAVLNIATEALKGVPPDPASGRATNDRQLDVEQREAGTSGNPIVVQPPQPETYSVQIDRQHYKLGYSCLTGHMLRHIPNPPIPEDKDLWEIVPGAEDRKIYSDTPVDIRDGKRFFSTPARINAGRQEPPPQEALK